MSMCCFFLRISYLACDSWGATKLGVLQITGVLSSSGKSRDKSYIDPCNSNKALKSRASTRFWIFRLSLHVRCSTLILFLGFRDAYGGSTNRIFYSKVSNQNPTCSFHNRHFLFQQPFQLSYAWSQLKYWYLSPLLNSGYHERFGWWTPFGLKIIFRKF